MKKQISILIALSMVLLLLTSCGVATDKTSEATTESTVATEPETTTIDVNYDTALQIEQVENSGVVLTIMTDKKVYKPDDKMVITYRVENSSGKEIYRFEQASYNGIHDMEPIIKVIRPSDKPFWVNHTIGNDVLFEGSLPANETIEDRYTYIKWVAFNENEQREHMKERTAEQIEKAKPLQTGKYIVIASLPFNFESHFDPDSDTTTPENADRYIEARCAFYITEDGKMPS